MNASIPLPATLRKKAQFELGIAAILVLVILVDSYHERHFLPAAGFLVMFMIFGARSIAQLRRPFIALIDETLIFLEGNRHRKIKVSEIEKISAVQTMAVLPKRKISRFIIRLVNDKGVHIIRVSSERALIDVRKFFAEHLGSKWQAEDELVKSLRQYSI